MTFLVHVLVTSVLLLVVANFVSGIRIEGWGPAIVAAVILGVVNAVIRPIMVLLTLPLTVLTFGLFLFVVNALMLQLAAAFVSGMKVKSFGSALIGSLLLSVMNVVAGVLLGVV